MPRDARDERVGYVLNRVRGTRIFSQFVALKVEFTVPLAELHVFDYGAEANSVPQERLFLAGEADAFGVAAAFYVEHTVVAPAQGLSVLSSAKQFSGCITNSARHLQSTLAKGQR